MRFSINTIKGKTMTNKSFRTYINLIESAQAGVAEGSENPLQTATNALNTIVGCFEAAEVEGLTEILANTQDERLKDLVERRLMYAYTTAQQALEKLQHSGSDEQLEETTPDSVAKVEQLFRNNNTTISRKP